MTRADLLPLLRWALRNPREAATALVRYGVAGLEDAWATAELDAMLAAEEARQEHARRVVGGVIDAIVRETRGEALHEATRPWFAMGERRREWEVN